MIGSLTVGAFGGLWVCTHFTPACTSFALTWMHILLVQGSPRGVRPNQVSKDILDLDFVEMAELLPDTWRKNRTAVTSREANTGAPSQISWYGLSATHRWCLSWPQGIQAREVINLGERKPPRVLPLSGGMGHREPKFFLQDRGT